MHHSDTMIKIMERVVSFIIMMLQEPKEYTEFLHRNIIYNREVIANKYLNDELKLFKISLGNNNEIQYLLKFDKHQN